jgi:hypothetical protein
MLDIILMLTKTKIPVSLNHTMLQCRVINRIYWLNDGIFQYKIPTIVLESLRRRLFWNHWLVDYSSHCRQIVVMSTAIISLRNKKVNNLFNYRKACTIVNDCDSYVWQISFIQTTIKLRRKLHWK